MAKYRVETVGAVIDRHPIGSSIELEEKTAKRLEAQGYVKIIGKVTKAKKAAAPKKPSKAAPKKAAEKKDTKK